MNSTICPHPEEKQRSWAVIPNLAVQWCQACGSLRFNDRWLYPDDERRKQSGSEISEARAGSTITGENRQLVERFGRTVENNYLDKPEQINIDARHAAVEIHHASERKQRFAKCGNCMARIPLTDDPTENHHAAMRHRLTCGKTATDQYPDDQLQQLIREFEAQPNIVAQRERWQKTGSTQLTAAAPPAGAIARRPWWKFW